MAELGMTNLAVARGFDHGPGLGIGEQGLEHQRIEPMAAAMGAVGAEDRSAGQSKVADRIERFAQFTGRENVIAGGDCGFSSQSSFTPDIHPTVVWAKFQALTEGAQLATKRLWS